MRAVWTFVAVICLLWVVEGFRQPQFRPMMLVFSSFGAILVVLLVLGLAGANKGGDNVVVTSVGSDEAGTSGDSRSA